jgi:hypothetical protein
MLKLQVQFRSCSSSRLYLRAQETDKPPNGSLVGIVKCLRCTCLAFIIYYWKISQYCCGPIFFQGCRLNDRFVYQNHTRGLFMNFFLDNAFSSMYSLYKMYRIVNDRLLCIFLCLLNYQETNLFHLYVSYSH